MNLILDGIVIGFSIALPIGIVIGAFLSRLGFERGINQK